MIFDFHIADHKKKTKKKNKAKPTNKQKTCKEDSRITVSQSVQ